MNQTHTVTKAIRRTFSIPSYRPGYRQLAISLLLCLISSTKASDDFAANVSNDAQYLCDNARLTVANKVIDNSIREISGIASSRSQKDVYWVISDSGNPAELVALDGSGKTLNRYQLANIPNRDWEDIAIARKPTGESYVYIAEIGDNKRRWEQISLYRVKEPAVSGDGSTQVLKDFKTMHFTYPDHKRNAEALFIDERDERFYLVTKETKKKFMWPFPDGPSALVSGSINNADQSTTPLKLETFIDFVNLPSAGHARFLDEVGSRPVAQAVTAADMHPDGNVIAVRTNGSLWLWPLQQNQSVVEAMMVPPCEAPSPLELGGEAVTFNPSGAEYITVAERKSQLSRFTATDQLSTKSE